MLSLVSEVADSQPLLLPVDDDQWLDRASARVVALVARRLVSEGAGVVFATRIMGEELTDLPELALGGLRDVDSQTVITEPALRSKDRNWHDFRVPLRKGG